MKNLLALLFFLLPSVCLSQTINASSSYYYLDSYNDSSGNTMAEAISKLGYQVRIKMSYKVKLLSRTKSVYTDSFGNRANCVEKSTATVCDNRRNIKVNGVNCIEGLTNVISLSANKKKVYLKLVYAITCQDNTYLSFSRSGESRFTISK